VPLANYQNNLTEVKTNRKRLLWRKKNETVEGGDEQLLGGRGGPNKESNIFGNQATRGKGKGLDSAKGESYFFIV